MKDLTLIMAEELSAAFEKAGYDPAYALVRTSDRPDLCEFQCNGAMSAAKQYHKAPIAIAGEVAANCGEAASFFVEAVAPGFLNMNVKPAFLASYLSEMAASQGPDYPRVTEPKKIIIDYGGPNVAKPIHVGHLRSAVIGESLKRIAKAVGNEVLGDIHLGDWGLQIGLVITELRHRSPDLPYFREGVQEYPAEAPFTVIELGEIYPTASAKAKEDEAYREEALAATHDLQAGREGYRALWQKIMEVSVADLKKNYERLDVHFDLWKGESDAQKYIPAVIELLKEQGLARLDEGALIVDVALPTDKKELPPCIILKSDGASLYSTTDIATIKERMELFDPDEILYVVDKRQGMHFEQVFRVGRKAGIVKPETELNFAGFGTMNGPNGKPFKTKEGGVMRLESLLNEIEEEMAKKIRDNKNVRDEDAEKTAGQVALSAVKYGDLSNQPSKDYIFDTEKFTSFEGNTGPYILYTIVRIKSILEKMTKEDGEAAPKVLEPASGEEKELMLALTQFSQAVMSSYEELAPHKLCAYIFALSNSLNRFYHGTRILGEEDAARRRSYLTLLKLVKTALEKSIDLLGFSAPEHM